MALPQPTINESGAIFSRGVLDYAADALTRVKQQFAIPAVQVQVLRVLVDRLCFMRSRIFLVLDDAKARLDAYRAAAQKVSEQLANGTERYDDLPQPALPFEHLGPTKDVDWIRQHILDERARLLEELRRLQERFWSDVQELKAQAAEVLAEYVGAATRLERIAGVQIGTPSLQECFNFLSAPEPEEVLIPSDTPAMPPPAGRLP
jgi:hypothetical protein